MPMYLGPLPRVVQDFVGVGGDVLLGRSRAEAVAASRRSCSVVVWIRLQARPLLGTQVEGEARRAGAQAIPDVESSRPARQRLPPASAAHAPLHELLRRLVPPRRLVPL